MEKRLTEQDDVRRLRQEARLPDYWAIPFARNRGRCGYCGCDVLADRLGYATAQIDHLLPQSKYPEHKDNPDNWMLSCYLCNHVKRDWDPLVIDEKADEMLTRNKAVLVSRARHRIRKRRDESKDREWLTVQRIMLGHPAESHGN